MKGKALLSLGVLLVLGGCAAVPYKCELGEECVGAQEAYSAAIENRGNSESVFGGPLEGEPPAEQDSALPESLFRPYAGGGLTDRPVYQPPQPIRIWIAPWHGEDGMLRSGQFIYATRAGGWQMGELREQGVGGSLLHERTVLRPAPPARAEGGGEGDYSRVQPATQLSPAVREEN